MSEAAISAGTPAPGRRGGRRRPAVPNAVLGTLVAVVVEGMLFAGFISAFLICKKSLPMVLWPPPDQPRFPVATTAWNTSVLLLSGVACFIATYLHRRARPAARRFQLASLALGLTFVVLQGVEWMQLLRGGLTLTSSLAGGYFYLLVGAHALHSIAGLMVLAWSLRRMDAGTLAPETASAVRVYWLFVVLLWPVLYWLVYLN